MEEMCDYINDKWSESSAIHLAAYSLWRMNWIHPFVDGNGRTARALSYLLLCLKLECRLPGVKTIPDLISEDKRPYYDALEAADERWEDNSLDLHQLENLLGDLLAKQLASVLLAASGGTIQEPSPIDDSSPTRKEP
jgi:Fic family protein